MDNNTLLLILQVVVALTQVTSLVALVIYVIKTWEMASATRRATEITAQSLKEMQAARDEETAPYVVVWFDVTYARQLIQLVIKNIGKGIATDVRVEFDPPLQTKHGAPMKDLVWIRDGIKSMPPGYEIRTFFDSTVTYINDPSLPLEYRVRVTYYGGLSSRQRVIEHTLDLAAHKGTSWVAEPGIRDLAKHIEAMVKEHRDLRQSVEQISNTLERGIRVSNSSFLTLTGTAPVSLWREAILGKLREFALIWLALYQKERQNAVRFTGLLNHSIAVSDQIIVLLSNRPDEVQEDQMIRGAEVLATRIHQLGSWDFFIDGGASWHAFLAEGDNIVSCISRLTDITQFISQPKAEADAASDSGDTTRAEIA